MIIITITELAIILIDDSVYRKFRGSSVSVRIKKEKMRLREMQNISQHPSKSIILEVFI